MLDLVFESATVIDGTGNAPRTADVGVQGGIIREVGRVDGAAHRRIDANGAWLTPGFIDLHTHYDGQASWDETFSPSVQHGVTTLLFGNCGVGFAPLAPGDRNRAIEGLISLMEGVEDIPGVALVEGVRFDWQSFPEYLDALERIPHTLDFLAQVQPQIQRNLVIAAAGRVQLGPGRADPLRQPGLDVHVHILQTGIEGEAARADLLFNTPQARFDFRKFPRGQDARFFQRPRMGDAAADVVTVKPPIERDGFAIRFKPVG